MNKKVRVLREDDLKGVISCYMAVEILGDKKEVDLPLRKAHIRIVRKTENEIRVYNEAHMVHFLKEYWI